MAKVWRATTQCFIVTMRIPTCFATNDWLSQPKSPSTIVTSINSCPTNATNAWVFRVQPTSFYVHHTKRDSICTSKTENSTASKLTGEYEFDLMFCIGNGNKSRIVVCSSYVVYGKWKPNSKLWYVHLMLCTGNGNQVQNCGMFVDMDIRLYVARGKIFLLWCIFSINPSPHCSRQYV